MQLIYEYHKNNDLFTIFYNLSNINHTNYVHLSAKK